MAIVIKPISAISLLALQILPYTYLVKYNFGQMFLTSQVTVTKGQNGNSLSLDSYDSVPTDRGGFSNGVNS